jgi:hypothetical protein
MRVGSKNVMILLEIDGIELVNARESTENRMVENKTKITGIKATFIETFPK